MKLSVTLGAGTSGNTGSITVNTDGRMWTKGTGIAFQIGSGEDYGPVIASERKPLR